MANLKNVTLTTSPKLWQRVESEVDDHSGTTEPMSISFILTEPRLSRRPVFAATKWIQVRNLFSGKLHYIQQIQSDVEIIDIIDKIDMSPFLPD